LIEPIIKIFGLFAGSVAGAACAFVIQVLLARELTLEEYGAFSTALATITLLSPLACMGVPGFLIRVFGVEGLEGVRWVRSSLKLASLGNLCILVILAVWGWLGPHDDMYFRLLCWMLPIVIGQTFAELVTVKLQLEERFYSLALWQIFPQLIRGGVVIGVMLFIQYEPIQHAYAAAYFMSSFLVAAVGIYSIKGMINGSFYLKGHSKKTAILLSNDVCFNVILRHSLPFSLTGVLYIIYFQSDIILLNYLWSEKAAGLYNVAFTIMVAVYLLPNIIYQKFLLPKLYRWVNHDKKQFGKVFRMGNIVMAVSGLLVMIPAFMMMPSLIPLLFGEVYKGVIPILDILLWCIPVRFLASSVVSVLVSESNVRRKTRCMAVVAIINVMLNCILIPLLGGEGAAITTVISEVLLLLLFYRMVKKHVEII